MKLFVFALVALNTAAIFAPCIGNECFPRLREEGRGHNFEGQWPSFHLKNWNRRWEFHGRQENQPDPKGDPCNDPAYKDAPFCQVPTFTAAGRPIPLLWYKNKDYAVTPIKNFVAGALEVRPYDPTDNNQKWIFTPANEYNNLYYITNAASNLSLTANAFASPLALGNKLNAQNQIFYVRPQRDGAFFVSAYGSDLYMDAQDDNQVLYPVLIIRNFDGDKTQRWLLN